MNKKTEMNKTLIVVLVVGLLLVGCVGFISYYSDEEEDTSLIAENQLRELDRVNKLLGVNPSDLADTKTREVSQQARDFVAKEVYN